MNIRVEHIAPDIEEEILIRLHSDNRSAEREQELLRLAKVLETGERPMIGTCGNEKSIFYPRDIYYVEAVERKVFAYTKEKVCELPGTLGHLEEQLKKQGFLRCSKSMIVNLSYIERFQSIMGNRILATLTNKETIVISRHYSGQLRAYLMEGKFYD